MIKKYRKKPVEIEAIKLTEDTIYQVMLFMGTIGQLDTRIAQDKFEDYKTIVRQDGGLPIKTLEGTMKADIGDYIIKGVKGEFYPCKPDIFKETYELIFEPDFSDDSF
jgi:hypothetical protein